MVPRSRAGNQASGPGPGCFPSRGPRRGPGLLQTSSAGLGAGPQVQLWACCLPLLRSLPGAPALFPHRDLEGGGGAQGVVDGNTL